jgi:hypothetical protein
MLCADLVDLQWRDPTGRRRRGVANLEDISFSGACLQVERPVPTGTTLRMSYSNGALTGIVKYCVLGEIGYFLGIEFEPGNRWSQVHFRPQHLVDPRSAAKRKPDCPT